MAFDAAVWGICGCLNPNPVRIVFLRKSRIQEMSNMWTTHLTSIEVFCLPVLVWYLPTRHIYSIPCSL